MEREREQRIRLALSGRAKALEHAKRERKQKRKTAGELLFYLNVCGIRDRQIRPVDAYVPRSYNLDRQQQGLLSHLFVRYPVPQFMYQACVKGTGDPFEYMHALYREWFVTLAQGGSFSKRVKGFMTSREAHQFLSAPSTNRIHENVWWAKMRSAGIPARCTDLLVERVFRSYFIDDPHGRMADAVRFYARYHHDMDWVTLGEVTDFLAWRLHHDPEFSLKGRTVTSVVKLTNEWQVQLQKAKLGRMVEWPGLGLPDWEYEARDRIWTATELRDNRELMNEGRKQKHCVYSYVAWCVSGRSAIFSLRAFRKIVAGYTDAGAVEWDRTLEQTRVTVEVNSQRAIVQVRGLLNRAPTGDEIGVLRRWAGDMGLVPGG